MSVMFWWILAVCGLSVGVNRLIRLLSHPRPSIRRAAALALRNFRVPRAVRPLIHLLTDSDDGVFCAACEALGLYEAEALGVKEAGDAIEGLYSALTSGNQRRMTAAGRALKQLGEGHVSEPYLLYFSGHASSAEDIKRLTDQGIVRPADLALDRLATATSKDQQRAVDLLVKIAEDNDEVLQRIIQRIRGKNKRLKCALCRVLGQVGGRLARAALREPFDDPDDDVVCAAIDALCQIAHSDDFEPIAELLDNTSKRATVRLRSLNAIVALIPQKARDRILARLRDGDNAVLRAAINAVPVVCSKGDIQAVDALIPLLSTDRPVDIRDTTCRALGKLGSSRAVQPLMDLFKQSALIVFEKAIRSYQSGQPNHWFGRLWRWVGEFFGKPWLLRMTVPEQAAIQEAMDQLGKGLLMQALRQVVLGGRRRDRRLFRQMVENGDLTAIDILVDWWPAFDKGGTDATSFPLRRIGKALATIEQTLGPFWAQLFCRNHLTRFEWYELRSEAGYAARYPACRTCEEAAGALTGVARAVCVVDGPGEPGRPRWVRQNGDVLAQWVDVGLFDFDEVEVRTADRWKIERCRLAVQEIICQPSHPEAKRYRRVTCTIVDGIRLPKNVLWNLRDTFRKVDGGEGS